MKTFNKQIISRLVPISILFLTIYSVIPFMQKGIAPVDAINNTTFWWGISILTLIVFYFSGYYFFDRRNRDNLLVVLIFLVWNAVCIVRGMFVAEHYWDWKGLITNTMALMLPIVIFSATNKTIVQSLLSFYIKYTLPLFLIFLLVSRSAGFFLMPISLLILFLPGFTKRQKIIIVALALIVIVLDFDTRSNVVKFVVPFLLMSVYYMRKIISVKLLETVRLSLFIIPIVLFALGVSGIFNVFKMEEYLDGDFSYTTTDFRSGETVEDDVTVDTRTFIYVEVLESAINNDYWLLGRTPARGNDSYTFGLIQSELTGRNERLTNEIGLSNVFTWTGVVGVIIYFLIFFRASYLAINRSNSIYMKILGLFVTFRWVYAWVEDVTNFTLNYFVMLLAFGMCFSISFRKMNNKEFTIWLRGIFDMRYVRYQFYLLKKGEEKKDVEIKNI